MVEVWVEPHGDGRWQWGVDDQLVGSFAAMATGGIAVDHAPTDPHPWQITALVLASRGGGRYDPTPGPPAGQPAPPPPQGRPPRRGKGDGTGPTLAERAATGRQGSL